MTNLTVKWKIKDSAKNPNVKVSFSKTSSWARKLDKIAVKSWNVVYTVYDKDKWRVSEKAKTLVLKYLKKLSDKSKSLSK